MITLCASKIDWKNGYGVANAHEIFEYGKSPTVFALKSPRTDMTKVFSVDTEEAEQCEFWDGEFTIYRSEDKKYAIRVWH